MSTRQRGRATTVVFEASEDNRGLADPLEELQSALIIAYENALEKGISPGAALAAILEMASSEIQRWSARRLED